MISKFIWVRCSLTRLTLQQITIINSEQNTKNNNGKALESDQKQAATTLESRELHWVRYTFRWLFFQRVLPSLSGVQQLEFKQKAAAVTVKCQRTEFGFPECLEMRRTSPKAGRLDRKSVYKLLSNSWLTPEPWRHRGASKCPSGIRYWKAKSRISEQDLNTGSQLLHV